MVFAPDMKPILKHLEEGMKLTQGCYRAIVLQEVMTTNGNPGRLHDWVAIAKEVSEKFS